MEGKVIQFDWDFIAAKDDTELRGVCLTWSECQILLTMVDYIGWSTRWFSLTGQTISQDKIEAWRDSISRALVEGACYMDCSDVWACLGISEPPVDLEAWLELMLSGNSTIMQAVQDTTSGGDGTVISPIVDELTYSGCDYDIIFGFCKQLVQFANSVITDFYEILEAATNPLEFNQIVWEDAPLMTKVSDFLAYMQDNIVEAYLANYTTELENTYACALFCKAIQNTSCDISYFDCYEYFMERFGEQVADTTVTELLQFIVGGSWSGSEFCDMSFALFFNILYYMGDFYSASLEFVKLIWESFFNDPDGDWETLCECGYELWYEYAELYQNGFDPVLGQWATSENYYSTSTPPYGITIEQTYGSAFDGLKKVELYTTYSGVQVDIYLTITHDGGTYYVAEKVLQWDYVTWNLPTTLNGVTYIKFNATTQVGTSVAFRHLQLTGAGDNPPPEPVNPP